MIGYPKIDSITSEQNAEIITTLEPLDITEDQVSLHVAAFLNEMNDWEMLKD